MQCLFKFFYGFQYDPANTIASTTAGANSMRHYKTYLGRYVVAQKYLVPKLCSQAKETFKCQLADSKTHCPEASVFPDLVRLIYITYADEAIDFRELLVNHFVQWTSKTQKNTEFRALFKEVTDFAFDVVDAAMRQNDNAAPAEAPPDKKRKV